MTPKAHAVFIQASCIFLLLIGEGTEGTVITSRGCLADYEGGYHIYYNKFFSYHKAIDQCKARRGVLPMPTQLSWSESLHAADWESKNGDDSGIWIGVTVTKPENSEVTFTDADNLPLNDTEIQSLSLSKDAPRFDNLENGQLCIVYYATGGNDKFRPQQCVSGRAKVLCRCTTGLRKRKAVEKSTTAPQLISKKPEKAAQTSLDKEPAKGNNGSLVKGKASGGIPSDGNEKFQGKGTDEKEEKSPVSTVTTILGIMLSVCVIAAAFFIVKHRRKRTRERVSRQMPYNGSHANENGDSCRQRRFDSEDSSGYHRPIHVYEEIFARDSNGVLSSSSPMISNGHTMATFPRLPPPEPPNTFVEIHEIRPDVESDTRYMRPSINRADGIPGDVRSPPPASRPVFDFPATPDSRREEHLTVPQKELKYASVETVQTLLDGETISDEEYFVDQESADAQYSSPDSRCSPLFMKLPEKQYEEPRSSPDFMKSNRNSVANPYIDINDLSACSPPPPDGSSEYENDRFLRTVMKVPPQKPRRTLKKIDNRNNPSKHIPSTNNEKNDSPESSSNPTVPLYSKVNKTPKPRQTDDEDSGYIESTELLSPGIGYTPMGRSPSQIVRQASQSEVATYADIPELPANSSSNTQSQSHDYEMVPATSQRSQISHPIMLSTTNTALSESTLACYEIPPEEYER